MDDKVNLLPLIKQARDEKKWLFCVYQSLWFSPDELELKNKEGRFRWGPVNWELRDPREKIRQMKSELKDLKLDIEDMEQRIDG